MPEHTDRVPDDLFPDPLLTLATAVATPDLGAQAAAGTALAERTEFGRLAEFAEWLAGATGSWPPRQLSRVRTIVFGNGVDPDDQPGGRVEVDGLSIRFVDCAPIGTADSVDADAVTAAVRRGAAVADEEIDSGADLLAAAVSSADSARAARAAVAVLTNAEPAKVMDRGLTATRPDRWMADTIAVRDLRRVAFPHRRQSGPLLGALGSAQLAAVTGFVLQAAGRRTGVLLDGLLAAASALIAFDASPQAGSWWLAADTSSDPAYELALTRLGLRPVLDLGIRRADGRAAALAVPVLRAAGALAR